MTSKVEFWRQANGFPGTTAAEAERAEADGWDGLSVPDSQNLTGDPYVALALAASVTSHLLLRTGVTNSFTRHPAVTAASILTVQVESKGRAVLGIGRGDSALAYLGLAPVPVNLFRTYVERVQGYLRGEEMPFDLQTDSKGEVASADALAMASAPRGSKLRWAQYARVPKVPVDGAVTGPKPIAAVAPVAERVTFAVGADPERVRWAIGIAREARLREGLDPDAVEWGVMLHVSPHLDRRTAIEMISGTVASTARFSVMHGRPLGPMSDAVRQSLLEIHRVYDMNKHARRGSHTAAMTDELIDTFTIAGPAEHCVERLLALRELGIIKFHVLAADWRNLALALQEHARKSLAQDVLPGVREGCARYEARQQ